MRLPYRDDDDGGDVQRADQATPAECECTLSPGDLPEYHTPVVTQTQPECPHCEDLGHVTEPGGIRHERCTCRYGRELPEAVLEAFNRPWKLAPKPRFVPPAQPRRPVGNLVPITPADIDKAAKEYRHRKQERG